MSAYISLAVLVIIIIWQGYSLGKAESRLLKIRAAIEKVAQNEDQKSKEDLLNDFLEDVCNSLLN